MKTLPRKLRFTRRDSMQVQKKIERFEAILGSNRVFPLNALLDIAVWAVGSESLEHK